MILQLTPAAIAALQSSSSPIVLATYRLGSAYNYIPYSGDAGLRGTQVWAGTPSAPLVENANLVKYSLYLDYDVGPFEFGEVALYMQNGLLFALGASNTLWTKTPLSSVGVASNAIRMDMYLSSVGTNYEMWADAAESNNQFRMSVIGSPDHMPPSHNAVPNAYIIDGATSKQSAFLAYTNRVGLWNFDCYQYITTQGLEATVLSADSHSVLISSSDYNPEYNPQYEGHRILQFTSGENYSICRYVQAAVAEGGNYRLSFYTPMAVIPNAGDKFTVFSRTAVANSNVVIDPATTTTLGGVIVGDGLSVESNGRVSVDFPQPPVTKVAGRTGDVELSADDISGLAPVATSNNYLDLDNRPSEFLLPTATLTQIGGVRLPTSGNLVIGEDGVIDFGFNPVTSVNGQGGSVELMGLIGPQMLNSGQNINNLPNSGLFYATTDVVAQSLVGAPTPTSQLRVCTIACYPLATTQSAQGDCVQMWVQADRTFTRTRINNVFGSWNSNTSELPVATTTSLGVVQVGSNLTIDSNGVLSASSQAAPLATTTSPGIVQVGSRLSINAQGVLSADSQEVPVATTTTLGVVRIGDGLSINDQGVVTANDQGGLTPSQVDAMITARLGGVNRQTLTGTGTFTVPANVTQILVSGCGGGGGGGGAGGGNSTVDVEIYPGRSGGGGGGGGAGQSVQNRVITVNPGQTISYSVGAGGSGGNGGNPGAIGSNGSAGGTTTFGTFISLAGGGQGSGGNNNTGTNPNAGAGGAGGAQGGTDGDDGFYGGAGGGGGSGVFGFGGGRTRGSTGNTMNGKNASGFGCGGGGGGGVYSEGGTVPAGRGGNGSPGTLIIEY